MDLRWFSKIKLPFMERPTLRTKRSRQWIPITLSLIATLTGCKTSLQKEVWVDLSAAAHVMRAESKIDWPTLATTSLAVASGVVSLPGLASTVVDRSVVAERRREARDLLQDQLQQTQSKLEEAYRVQLQAKVRALQADLRAALRDTVTEQSERSIEAISQILQASADVRGPIIVRLGLLAGWPDDGRSDFVRFASQKGPVEEAWDAEARRLRAELEEHDAFVSRQVLAVLSNFDQMLEADRAANLARIEEARKQAEAQAAQMARERFAETARLTLPKLLDENPTVLPGLPATTLTIPGSSEATVRSAPPSQFPIPTDVLKSRLEIWLHVRGYRLAAGPGLAPDMTGEFIAWINQP
jgi:hypothetical protein